MLFDLITLGISGHYLLGRDPVTYFSYVCRQLPRNACPNVGYIQVFEALSYYVGRRNRILGNSLWDQCR